MQKKYLIIILLVILNIIFFNTLEKKKHYLSSKETIGIYMNDNATNKIPSKDNASFAKAVCDGDANYYWDNTNWGLFIGDLNQKIKCNLYFKSKDTITIGTKNFIIDEYNKCPQKYLNDKYNITNLEDEYGYFCETNDDYGTTYYYRGVGANNNVYFANLYWQIIRINGDGSIRLLYNGNVKNAEGTAKTIGQSQYNYPSNKPAYVGYMFGKNVDTYEDSIKNEVNSTVKEKVDNWYFNNLLNTEFEKYIADSGFCNDRTLYNGNGITSATFNGYNRLKKSKNPTLICPNKDNDLFTTVNSIIGNKALTYPVGLMSADETLFAGSVSGLAINENSYLYSNNWYWTMTPINYEYADWNKDYLARTYTVGYKEDTDLETFIASSYNIRPVINIKDNILNKGDGSVDNPFRIE